MSLLNIDHEEDCFVEEIISFLLSNQNIDLTHLDNQGNNILMYLTWNDCDFLDEIMSRKCLSINAQNNKGWTLLHAQVPLTKLHVIRKIIETYNFNILLKDNKNRTILDMAKKYKLSKAETYLQKKFNLLLDNNDYDLQLLENVELWDCLENNVNHKKIIDENSNLFMYSSQLKSLTFFTKSIWTRTWLFKLL